MPQDMRTWIDQLEKAGLLARITKPVDPRTQMGALLWQARDRGLLFENLPGYPGWRCLGQAPGDVALAPVAFGAPRGTLYGRLVPSISPVVANRIRSQQLSRTATVP